MVTVIPRTKLPATISLLLKKACSQHRMSAYMGERDGMGEEEENIAKTITIYLKCMSYPKVEKQSGVVPS